MDNNSCIIKVKETINQIVSEDLKQSSLYTLYNKIVDSPLVTVDISQSSFTRTLQSNNTSLNLYVIIAISQYYQIDLNNLLLSQDVNVIKEKLTSTSSKDICGNYSFIAYLAEKGTKKFTFTDFSISQKQNKYFASLKLNDEKSSDIFLEGLGFYDGDKYSFKLASLNVKIDVFITDIFGRRNDYQKIFGVYILYNDNYSGNYKRHFGKFFATTESLTETQINNIATLLNIDNDTITVQKELLYQAMNESVQFKTFVNKFLKYDLKNSKDSERLTYRLNNIYKDCFCNTKAFSNITAVLMSENPPEYKTTEYAKYNYAVESTLNCLFKLLSISDSNKRLSLSDNNFSADSDIIFEYLRNDNDIHQYEAGKQIKVNRQYELTEKLFKSRQNSNNIK